MERDDSTALLQNEREWRIESKSCYKVVESDDGNRITGSRSTHCSFRIRNQFLNSHGLEP